VATGRRSDDSSPSLAISATSSTQSPPPSSSRRISAFSPSSTVVRQQQSFPSSSAIGDPSPHILPSAGSAGLNRSASTALRDDPPDSPRPRKRPRLTTTSTSDLESTMKYEADSSTDVGEPSDTRESNGNDSKNVRNGKVKFESSNGVSSAVNGHGNVKNGSRPSDRFFGHSRQEVTRLIIQALNDLGYS